MIKLTASEIEELLTTLCVRLGFCLRPSAILRFKNSPPPDIDSFTDAVFIAEGLDPRSDRKLRAQVRAIVSDRFAVPQSSHTKKVSDSKLHPDFPVVEDNYQMTDEWSLTLPLPFNRRFEKGSLVIWRPRLTFWINVWGNDNNQTADERLAWILEDANPERREERVERADGIVRLTYELSEEDPEHTPAWYTSISAYVISDLGHVQISAYCDNGAALQMGYDVIRSVRLDTDVEGRRKRAQPGEESN